MLGCVGEEWGSPIPKTCTNHEAEEKWLLIIFKTKDTDLNWGGTVFSKNKNPWK